MKKLSLCFVLACSQPLQPTESKSASLTSASHDALIDITTGTLAHGATELDPDSLTGDLHDAVRDAVANLEDAMALQNSDGYSVRTVVFASADKTTFGVWSGAPGDIGYASVLFLDADGHFLRAQHEVPALTSLGAALVTAATAAIDLTTGEIKGGTPVEIAWADGWPRALGLSSEAAASVEGWMNNGFDFMHLQGSDSYSISPTVVAVEAGGATAYAVWVGAPGDIGNARLVVVDVAGLFTFIEE